MWDTKERKISLLKTKRPSKRTKYSYGSVIVRPSQEKALKETTDTHTHDSASFLLLAGIKTMQINTGIKMSAADLTQQQQQLFPFFFAFPLFGEQEGKYLIYQTIHLTTFELELAI